MPGPGRTWKIDETCTRAKGRRTCLCRAVADDGRTIGFHLSQTRNPGEAPLAFETWEEPVAINIDEAGSHGRAIRERKREGEMPEHTRHRQVKHLNNPVEAEHGRLERVIRPVTGFKSMRTDQATPEGFEVTRALEKGQAALWRHQDGIAGEARLVERALGLGPSGMADAMHRLRRQMGQVPA